MHLEALATATPPQSFTQRECWDFIRGSRMQEKLKERSLKLLQKVLLNDNGIGKRHFALNDLEQIFDYHPDDLSAGFEREAPALAAHALTDALEKAERLPAEIDALFICTCTGYLCPGLTSYVSEQIGLQSDCYLQDNVGAGCGAAIPALRAADHFLQTNPDAIVAIVAVEICSAAFFLDDDPGVLISACLFGDGAAAAIWSGKGDGLRAFDFQTLLWPQHREMLRFQTSNGKLRNRLTKAVPATAAKAVKDLFEKNGKRPVSQIISHPGGRDVLVEIEALLPYRLAESANVLRQFGNMSSPSVLFALEEQLQKPTTAAGDLWLTSFGAGFSCHSCRIGYSEH